MSFFQFMFGYIIGSEPVLYASIASRVKYSDRSVTPSFCIFMFQKLAYS